MQTSAISLVSILTEIDVLVSSSLTDEQKVHVLDDIDRCIPPEQFCVNCLKTRAIVKAKIKETINGLKTNTKEKSQKPIKSRAGKASTKSAKK